MHDQGDKTWLPVMTEDWNRLPRRSVPKWIDKWIDNWWTDEGISWGAHSVGTWIERKPAARIHLTIQEANTWFKRVFYADPVDNAEESALLRVIHPAKTEAYKTRGWIIFWSELSFSKSFPVENSMSLKGSLRQASQAFRWLPLVEINLAISDGKCVNKWGAVEGDVRNSAAERKIRTAI